MPPLVSQPDGPAPASRPQGLLPDPAAPRTVAGSALTFVLLRARPLTVGEHESVADVASRQARRPLRHVVGPDGGVVEIVGLEGMGEHRVMVRCRLVAPDLGLADLPVLAELLDELTGAVPGAELKAADPLALFGLRDGQVRWDGQHLLPALPPGWQPAPGTRLQSDDAAPPEARRAPPPATESELADLLEIIDNDGADDALLQVGAAGALRHLPALREALFSGRRPGAACRVFASLAGRGLPEALALAEGARALLSDGDAREREAAAALLEALSAHGDLPGQDAGTEWSEVASLGRLLLSSPTLAPPVEEPSDAWEPAGSAAEEADDGGADDLWEDDLLLDEPEAELPALALPMALAELDQPALLARAGALAQLPSFPRKATARLTADPDSAAGAALLVATGAWPTARLPGWFQALSELATTERPLALRAVALAALGAAGGPDADALLIQASTWDEPVLAGAAVVALGARPGAAARTAVRAALARTELAPAALVALARAGDVGGFDLAAGLLRDGDDALRALAAEVLDGLGGSRAIAALEAALEDPAVAVRHAAARGLARVSPGPQVARLLSDATLAAEILWAIGQVRRADLAGHVLGATRHRDASVRHAAVVALGALALPATTPSLISLLVDEDEAVAVAALHALGRAGDSRATRVLRILAAHPGPPGRLSESVLAEARRLRQAPPDDQVLVRAHADHPLTARSRSRMTAALRGLPLDLTTTPHGLQATGRIAPDDLSALSALARALAAIDAIEPGLSWTVRDGQGLVRRVDGGWTLARHKGALARDAGWRSTTLPPVERVPLAALQATPEPSGEPLSVGPEPALFGTAGMAPRDDEELFFDEDVEDEATEQTISAFLEEVTGQGAPPQKAPFVEAESEELLFDPEDRTREQSPPPRRRS